MIDAIQNNLNRGVKLLNSISDELYSDTSVAPYYSSIGGHMRHVLDVFDCIFEGLESNSVNLIHRKRNSLAENFISNGLLYFEEINIKLESLKQVDLNRTIKITDDLGNGSVTITGTLASALMQAHSHAIHHFASVGYVVAQLKIQLPDADFGFNPTTPRLHSN
jgi:uncharacterized damage-inducible protein DinB